MRLLVVILGCLAFTGCGGSSKPKSELARIETRLGKYRVQNMADGDSLIGGGNSGPAIIQVSRRWADHPQIKKETPDGHAGFSFTSQISFYVAVAGDSSAVVKEIADAMENDPTITKKLFRHSDPRIRLATYYTLEHSEPFSTHLPKSQDVVLSELAHTVASSDVFASVKALDLLSDTFSEAAFHNAMEHPCAQVRLAGFLQMRRAKMTDAERLSALPILVAQLDHRDRVVRESAYANIDSLMQHWRQEKHDGRELPADLEALIQSVPSDPGNGNWFKEMAAAAKLIIDNQQQWTDWLETNGVAN